MKFVMQKRLGRFLEFALIFCMLLAVALMSTLHLSIPDVTQHYPGEPEHLFEKYYAVLMVSGVMAELILWQGVQVMRRVNRGNAFSQDTVRRLCIIGWEALALALFYFIMTFFVHKFFMVIVFVAFSVIGLVLFVLAQLFADALQYKNENDMTV